MWGKGWFRCGICELKMSRDEVFPAEGPSRKGKERQSCGNGSLGQQQSLKLFYPFLRQYSFLNFFCFWTHWSVAFVVFFFTCILNATILQNPPSAPFPFPLCELSPHQLSASGLCVYLPTWMYSDVPDFNIQDCSYHPSPSLLESPSCGEWW